MMADKYLYKNKLYLIKAIVVCLFRYEIDDDYVNIGSRGDIIKAFNIGIISIYVILFGKNIMKEIDGNKIIGYNIRFDHSYCLAGSTDEYEILCINIKKYEYSIGLRSESERYF